MRYITMGLLMSLILAPACSKKLAGIRAKDNSNHQDELIEQNSENGSADLVCTGLSEVTYQGFGGRKLGVGRTLHEDIPELGDRFRVKPYEVLEAEFMRVTSIIPVSLAQAATTFAAAPERWYAEPQATSVTLFTTYKIAYEAALKMIDSDTKFAAAPSEATARQECTSFAQLAWNRVPSPAEIGACIEVAVTHTAEVQDNKVRWAHTFASVLTASGFISY